MASVCPARSSTPVSTSRVVSEGMPPDTVGGVGLADAGAEVDVHPAVAQHDGHEIQPRAVFLETDRGAGQARW